MTEESGRAAVAARLLSATSSPSRPSALDLVCAYFPVFSHNSTLISPRRWSSPPRGRIVCARAHDPRAPRHSPPRRTAAPKRTRPTPSPRHSTPPPSAARGRASQISPEDTSSRPHRPERPLRRSPSPCPPIRNCGRHVTTSAPADQQSPRASHHPPVDLRRH